MIRRPSLILLALTAAAAAATAAGASGTSPPAPPAAVVRVDQVGYATGATKRAFLMSETAERGAMFRVVDAHGRTVYRGRPGRSTGSWSARYAHVYPLDFDGVHTSGTYRIVVKGSAGPTSPRFRIEAPRALYSGALANSLFFYEAERDGPDFIRSALRTAPGPPERRARDDLPHAEGERRRRLQRRPEAARRRGSTPPAAGGTRATT